jgi:MtN3 and saliva related transmembrane protein
MSYIGEFLGYLAGVCTAICFLPQTIQTIKSHNVSGLSLLSYVIYCTGVLSWILYGAYVHSVQMVIFNSISLFFATIILYMIAVQRTKKH